MNFESLETILECMPPANGSSDIQRIQTAHRYKLAKLWNIKEGDRVLEIGCGQGDTTAVLAYLVGEKGFVHGVDIAPPDYGSPITVGASAAYLKKSRLGKQIKIEFEVDILSSKTDFPERSFDVIVLSQCSWYLKSLEELNEILTKVRKWGKQLCYAEWDPRIKTIDQLPHLLATLIQAQYECYKKNSSSNMRTLVTPNDVKSIAKDAGWTLTDEQSISSIELQDAKWEVDMTLNGGKEVDKLNDMPIKFKSLINSELSLLEESIAINELKPLSIYSFIAH